MSKLIIFLLLVTTASCSSKQGFRDENIQIVIKDAQSYKYDLYKQTFTIYRIFKADTTIHFKLSTKEKKETIDYYYDLGLDKLKGKLTIEDRCMMMPKFYTALKIQSKEHVVEILIDEDCKSYNLSSYFEARRINKFLKLLRTIIKNKPELKHAPDSDIIYE